MSKLSAVLAVGCLLILVQGAMAQQGQPRRQLQQSEGVVGNFPALDWLTRTFAGNQDKKPDHQKPDNNNKDKDKNKVKPQDKDKGQEQDVYILVAQYVVDPFQAALKELQKQADLVNKDLKERQTNANLGLVCSIYNMANGLKNSTEQLNQFLPQPPKGIKDGQENLQKGMEGQFQNFAGSLLGIAPERVLDHLNKHCQDWKPKGLEGIQKAFDNVPFINDIGKTIGDFGKQAQDQADKFQEQFSTLQKQMTDTFNKQFGAFQKQWSPVDLNKNFNEQMQKLPKQFNDFMKGFQEGMNKNIKDAQDTLQKNVQGFNEGAKNLQDNFSKSVKSLQDNLKKGAEGWQENMQKGLGEMQSNLKELQKNMQKNLPKPEDIAKQLESLRPKLFENGTAGNITAIANAVCNGPNVTVIADTINKQLLQQQEFFFDQMSKLNDRWQQSSESWGLATLDKEPVKPVAPSPSPPAKKPVVLPSPSPKKSENKAPGKS